MKKLINLLVVISALLSSELVIAKVFKVDEDLPKATKVITEVTKNALKDIEIEKESVAYVLFTINSDNELVVLDVKNSDKNVRQIIKSALNFKSLEEASLVAGKTYGVIVRLKQ
ncbi:hypothetical protein [Flavobacterium oreochromis]|uniref:TonB C-terminal domain-containing protein n=2 Tax=Flavobacterium TaxID=237 RepID=A0A246G9Q5_9FLAO|nr:hypothetical protein [Flavobacterium oreochromis]OWP74555.1 hypothetical protein BWK62_14030 [Flavobacterium oreochromis]OWP75523.1 hypothetical protein BWG23_10810 [Flavobacterium oreochromis]POR26118.1 hypothetical protein BWK58_05640 [Flavobacterium columnare]QYS86710.1 hypothetical protein JJC03_01215 [Flavobacterium oreochromis]